MREDIHRAGRYLLQRSDTPDGYVLRIADTDDDDPIRGAELLHVNLRDLAALGNAANLRRAEERGEGLLCHAPQNGRTDALVCDEPDGHLGVHRAELHTAAGRHVVEWHGHTGRCRAHLTLDGGTIMTCDLDAGHDGMHRDPLISTDANGRFIIVEPSWWDDGRHEVRCVVEDCTVTISCRADPDDPVLEDWAAELGWDPVGDGWVCPAH